MLWFQIPANFRFQVDEYSYDNPPPPHNTPRSVGMGGKGIC